MNKQKISTGTMKTENKLYKVELSHQFSEKDLIELEGKKIKKSEMEINY